MSFACGKVLAGVFALQLMDSKCAVKIDAVRHRQLVLLNSIWWPSHMSAHVDGRKRQLANKAAEAAPGAGIEDAVNVLSPAPDAAAGAGGAAQLVAEPTTQPPVLATEQLPSEQQPAAGCSDHAEMVMGPMPTELDATAEMETDAAAVTDGVDKVPVTTDAEDAAAAPMAVLMDETAADDQGEGATIDVDKQQVADAAAPAQDREADAAVRGGTDAWPAGAASDAAAAPSATDVPTPADGAASSAAQTGTDKVWGPVVKAQGSGPGRGKWAGVDPVNFITDEGVLSSLVQYYGFGGPSEDVVRKHLVRFCFCSGKCIWPQTTGSRGYAVTAGFNGV